MARERKVGVGLGPMISGELRKQLENKAFTCRPDAIHRDGAVDQNRQACEKPTGSEVRVGLTPRFGYETTKDLGQHRNASERSRRKPESRSQQYIQHLARVLTYLPASATSRMVGP